MADDYFNAFGGGDALRDALRSAMAPNRLAGGQASTQDVIGAIPRPAPSAGLVEALRDRAMRGDVGATNLLAQDAQAKANAPWWSSEGLAASKPNAMGNALSAVPPELMFLSNFLGPGPKRIPNPIKAYHGSPHDFDKFDLSKIGTGEGHQAYGHGIYMAENEGTARFYRDALSTELRKIKDTASPYASLPDEKAIAQLERAAQHNELNGRKSLAKDYREAAEWIKSGRSDTFSPGRMYEVAIHATPDQFLDWDKPLSQQSEAVRRALATMEHKAPGSSWSIKDNAETINAALQHENLKHLLDNRGINKTGSDILNDLGTYTGHGKPESSKALADAGIEGIRYLDQGSRNGSSGTSNLVVFNPELIEILRKYGILGPVAAGGLANALSGDQGQ